MRGKAIFWDFDGTLILPNESFLWAWEYGMNSCGYGVDAETLRSVLHASCTWYRPEESYENARGKAWWEVLFEKFEPFYSQMKISREDGQKINERFREYILDYRNYSVYEDARRTLEDCRALGFRNYILSNNFPELPEVIEKLGLSQLLDGYVISSRVGYEKPRKEIFDSAVELAEHPEICYMVGDNPVADIQGARQAGMKTILVHGKPEQRVHADFVCPSLGDIPGYLR